MQAQSTEPLSAIDWLNKVPTVTLEIEPEAPVAAGGNTPKVSVSALGTEGRDAVGLLSSAVTGLPSSLWQESRGQVLADLIAIQPQQSLPAMQALLYTLLLAEANPPVDSDGNDTLLLARIDKLVRLGALEQANALLDRSGADTPDLFERRFDVTLLIGEEDSACETLSQAAHLAPSYAARVFCAARSGDWNTAAVTLNSANFLGLLTEEEDALLLRFLDPELFAEDPILVTPSSPDPLKFRLYEAIGEPQPTTTLPLQYAHSDLRDTAGWKAQLEAAERLARVGALPENRLLGIYAAGKPAASGMIWDRVDALQKFDTAIATGDAAKVSVRLPSAWAAMQASRLEVPFARLYAEPLMTMSLSGVSQTLARKITLLSPAYELAAKRGPRDYLAGLALGLPPRRGQDTTSQAISDAFHGAGVPQSLSNSLARGHLGEVILQAMTLFSQGAAGDLPALTSALATFRAVGLDDTARQAALQILLLERGF
ncbi:hypothetical protein [Cognatishimia sp. WU-CL00825]|uniref:hypothetical protein n=1 Tax=Cognatishimia sp. WU-CL00825 TaxID=3127658 RepID=UPI0033657369